MPRSINADIYTCIVTAGPNTLPGVAYGIGELESEATACMGRLGCSCVHRKNDEVLCQYWEVHIAKDEVSGTQNYEYTLGPLALSNQQVLFSLLASCCD
jgi:hypothetical protein